MSASRIRDIDVSGVRKMFRKASSKSIHLGIGQPDFPPPQHVIDAFVKAVLDGHNGYGPVEGLFELREAVAARLRKYRDDITRENVIVTSGATEALLSIDFTLFEDADEVLIPDPGFIIFDSQLRLCGAKPVRYVLRYEKGFIPDAEDIQNKITPRTKAIIVNSPSNPTGCLHDEDVIKSITDMAQDNDLIIITDEVYDEIVYDASHRSYLGNYDKIVYVNSFSKSYAINGWRLGYVVADMNTIKDINKFHYYTIGCPNMPAQYAAVAALEGPRTHLEEMVAEFKARRDLIVEELNSIEGLSCIKPRGTFYAFPRFDFSLSSEKMADLLLDAGLICAPGTAFGPFGEGHLRFSFANSRKNIKVGMDILRRVVATLQ